MKYCSIKNCYKPRHARGFCSMHNARYLRHGDPTIFIGRKKEQHGRSNSREYVSWKSMNKRCSNKNDPKYQYYGGSGITVCSRWANSFNLFFEDMGTRPIGTSLDRIDNSIGYTPSNCRWATRTEQVINRRINSNNKTSMRGVSAFGSKWRSAVKYQYKQYHLGLFNCVEDAAIAYDIAMFQLHGENTNMNYKWSIKL